MVAGSLGMQSTSSDQKIDCGRDHASAWNKAYEPAHGTEEPDLDTLQPLTGWLMYKLNE